MHKLFQTTAKASLNLFSSRKRTIIVSPQLLKILFIRTQKLSKSVLFQVKSIKTYMNQLFRCWNLSNNLRLIGAQKLIELLIKLEFKQVKPNHSQWNHKITILMANLLTAHKISVKINLLLVIHLKDNQAAITIIQL